MRNAALLRVLREGHSGSLRGRAGEYIVGPADYFVWRHAAQTAVTEDTKTWAPDATESLVVDDQVLLAIGCQPRRWCWPVHPYYRPAERSRDVSRARVRRDVHDTAIQERDQLRQRRPAGDVERWSRGATRNRRVTCYLVRSTNEHHGGEVGDTADNLGPAVLWPGLVCPRCGWINNDGARPR